MEIGTVKMENGKGWDCKVHGKHVENSANSTIYVLPKVLDVYYNLAVSQNGYCWLWLNTVSITLPIHAATDWKVMDWQSWLIHSWFASSLFWTSQSLPHDFSVIVVCHMTFQSLWWFATWLFSHCGIFIHDFAFIVWFSIQSQQFIGFPYNWFHSECSQ